MVDTLLAGGYDGPVHFDFKPPRTEDDEGVWVVGRRVHAELPDPAGRRPGRSAPTRRWSSALRAAARTPSWPSRRWLPGETWRDVRGFSPDADALGRRGMGFERLDQLALEHLYGVR